MSQRQKTIPPKIAFFAEGQTEQIFIEKLLTEVAGSRKIKVETVQAMGGRKFSRLFYKLTPETNAADHSFYALIYNCGSDGRVASDVRDQYPTLMTAGYTAIIAIRDVAQDFTRSQIPKLRAGFSRVMPAGTVTPLLVLATMEVEAWFMGEHTHFSRLDATLTEERIWNDLGINLISDDLEDRGRPSHDLVAIYGLVGLTYSKSKADAERTTGALDYDRVQKRLPTKMPSFKPLMDAVSAFLQ